MNELHYFKTAANPEINVALAGIHKHDWVHAKARDAFDISVAKMSNNRFDILPIVQNDGTIKQCYKTKIWSKYNEHNIEKYEITREDRLYYLTHIHDAIIKFAKTNSKFFFLDNQMEIIGLITIGNLNCKHVYLYLYNMIIQIEHAMGNFIYKAGITDKDLVELFEQRNDSLNAKDALKRHRADDAKGLDYDFVEYIYMVDLGYIFKKSGLIEKLGMKEDDFMQIISKINEIRTIVAHPNKSLIRNDNSIQDVYKAITGIDNLIEKLI